MTLELPKDLSAKLFEASKILDLEEKEIVNRAVILYLDSAQKYIRLKKELSAWDELSDEALENFERDL